MFSLDFYIFTERSSYFSSYSRCVYLSASIFRVFHCICQKERHLSTFMNRCLVSRLFFTASCFANIINFRWQIVGKSYIHSLNNLLTPLIYRDNFTIVSQWDELIQLMYLRILTKGSYVEICRLFRTFVGTYPLIVPFTKKALLLGVPSIIKIGVINSLFSLPESSFRFDTLDFQCLDSRSTKFLDLQLTELYTTITASCFHFKYF